jgi:uncharacterized glyoxalase superfamily protein PhnB
MSAAPAVIPAIRYQDTAKAVRWLVDVFGFEDSFVVADDAGNVGHAQLTYGGTGMIMLGPVSDGSDGRLAVRTGPVLTYVIVDDIEKHYAHTRSAGAEIIQELQDEDYGGQGYTALDPEGNVWSFGTYRPDMD